MSIPRREILCSSLALAQVNMTLPKATALDVARYVCVLSLVIFATATAATAEPGSADGSEH